MPEVDKELAAHCLEDLGTVERGCKIIKEIGTVRTPTDACDGWSIRDRLFSFAVQAFEIRRTNAGSTKHKRLVKFHEATGQFDSLTYAVALMDNPYRPDHEAVKKAVEMEVYGSA